MNRTKHFHSKSDRKTHDVTYAEYKIMVQMNLLTKHKCNHGCRIQTYGYQEGKWGDINWEIGIDIYILIYIKEMTSKTFCIAQGTLFNTL